MRVFLGIILWGISLNIYAACPTTTSDGCFCIKWIAPTENLDGSPLTDGAGFEIHYGSNPGMYAFVEDVPNFALTEQTVCNVSTGTKYTAMKAYDLDGNFSQFSNEVAKEVTGADPPWSGIPGSTQVTVSVDGEVSSPPEGGDVATVYGFNFRATSGYVTDAADDTYVISTSDGYPTNRNSQTFGWDSTFLNNDRDRDDQLDPRLAGIMFRGNTSTRQFQIDLPEAGTYNIRLALGDAGAGSNNGSIVKIYDNTTLKSTVLDGNQGAAGTADWYDATGVSRNGESAWVNNNAALEVEFSTTTLIIEVEAAGSGNQVAALAHVSYELVGAGGDPLDPTFVGEAWNAGFSVSSVEVTHGLTINEGDVVVVWGVSNIDSDGIIERNMAAGRLRFTTDAAMAVAHGRFQFIAVGTPPDEDGSADLKHVLAVARTIAEHMGERRVVINKSTVPVGTADRVRSTMAAVLAERDREFEVDVVSNPEFLKEGAAIDDCMRPDRIVIGVDNMRVRQEMHDLYAPYVKRNEDVLIFMDIRSAELTKYAANAMLATKISFMNELANIAERVGADIEHVRHGIGSDRRIGYHFIYPGAGYGGSCFPKDVTALHRTARQSGYDARILDAVEAVNDAQKNVLFARLQEHFGELSGRTIALWGLAFKPNTDDMREAPSRRLMEQLWAAGARVRAYDPEAMDECRRIYGQRDDLELCAGSMQAAEGADALAVVTEWKAFWNPDFDALRDSLIHPVVVDGRNIFDPDRMRDAGYCYYSIGRVAAKPEGGA